MDEIEDPSVEDAIHEISQRTAENEPERDTGNDSMAAVANHHPRDHDHRREDHEVQKDPGQGSAVGKEAEGDPGVADMGDGEPGEDVMPTSMVDARR